MVKRRENIPDLLQARDPPLDLIIANEYIMHSVSCDCPVLWFKRLLFAYIVVHLVCLANHPLHARGKLRGVITVT